MTRRRSTLVTLPLAVLAVASCGNSSHFDYHPTATVPINVSVYVNARRVALSPASVTPGPISITITNQASTAEALKVVPGSGTPPLAVTGPISPQGTDQVTVNVNAGNYTITTAPDNSTDAAAATPTGILPGLLQVQGQRPAASPLQAP